MLSNNNEASHTEFTIQKNSDQVNILSFSTQENFLIILYLNFLLKS
jgi:hypothetical protein